MKKIFLLFTPLLLLSSAFAQNVMKDKMVEFVWQKYPESEEVDWAESDNGFTAGFYDGSQLKTAVFDKSGNWVQTESNLLEENTESSILEAVKKEYPGAKISRVQQVEEGKFYYFSVWIVADEAGQLLKIDPMGGILSVQPVAFIDEDE